MNGQKFSYIYHSKCIKIIILSSLIRPKNTNMYYVVIVQKLDESKEFPIILSDQCFGVVNAYSSFWFTQSNSRFAIEHKRRSLDTQMEYYNLFNVFLFIHNKYCLANARRNLICRLEAASLFTSSLLFALSSSWPKAAI